MNVCERCNQVSQDVVETDRGFILCFGCDSQRLSCVNNPETEMTEDEFYKEIKEKSIKYHEKMCEDRGK